MASLEVARVSLVSRLQGVVQHYAWGSTTAIPAVLGAKPDGRPWAELWLGAHPTAPSQLNGLNLDRCIAEHPEEFLGPRVRKLFGGQLPFLLKILAAETPLSLQAHPSAAQAQAGFARENNEGLSPTDPRRNYRDPNPKPEILCALTTFKALSGFRAPHDLLALLIALDAPAFGDLVDPMDLKGTFLRLFEPQNRRPIFASIVAGCRRILGTPQSQYAEAALAILQLAELYPEDPGVPVSSLLDHVELAPGEAIYLPAGNLHSYLHGIGIELMAASDNVLRGGNTPKHVDLAELTRVLSFRPGNVTAIQPKALSDSPEVNYPTDAHHFALSRIQSVDFVTHTLSHDGPEIWLTTEGRFTVTTFSDVSPPAELALAKGQACFVRGQATHSIVSGLGTLFRAKVP